MDEDKIINLKRLDPVILPGEWKNFGFELDKLIGKDYYSICPSKMIQGVFHSLRAENAGNPDTISQTANTLRSLLYPIFSKYGLSKKYESKSEMIFGLLKNINKGITKDETADNIKHEATNINKALEVLHGLWKTLSDLSHHCSNVKSLSKEECRKITIENFKLEILPKFLNAYSYIILIHLNVHEFIDNLVKGKGSPKIELIKIAVNFSFDSKQYFFSEAPESWIKILWENEFLDVIKEKAKDPTRYGYRTPEVNYLARITKKEPAKVVDIILAVPISVDTFNPEVIDQFLRICSVLPAEQLARVVPKIHKERWVHLMGVFNQWGYEYEKMLKILADAKDYKSLLILAESILEVRDKKEVERKRDNLFYFNDLSYTKVFEHLASIDNEYTEKALELTAKAIAKVVLLGGENKNDSVFSIKEAFYFYDVDFFELSNGEKRRLSHRDDVRELAAVVKKLVEHLIGEKCGDREKTYRIYKNYIQKLPDNESMWRFKLYVLSLCPNVFKNELKEAFFNMKCYDKAMSEIEYEKALGKGFSALNKDDQCKYVKLIMNHFGKFDEDPKVKAPNIRYGSRILSVISTNLTQDEKVRIKAAGFKLDSDYEPKSNINRVRGGTVAPRGPITQEEFGKLSISVISNNLQSEWTPDKLHEQNTMGDFLTPINAEGAGRMLKTDIPQRLQDYITNSNLFFDREKLAPHYTYSFFEGVSEVIRKNRENVSEINWDKLINLCIAIKKSNEESKRFDRKKREAKFYDTWLANWTAVHSAMTDVVQELLDEKNGNIAIDFSKYRNQLFAIINYLLSYSDPRPEDEKIESAKMQTKSPGDEEYFVSDPFSMAINTVRGRAFQALTLFVYQDSKKFSKSKTVKIDSDIKKLYETVLKNENTRALMFMFGYYLPSFYYRDKEWVQGLLPQIFSEDPKKKHLYTAAWEGYLANNLYKEIFFDPAIQALYRRGINLTDTEYPNQKHFKDPDEGIAVHFALAFMYHEDFGFDHSLFQSFWKIDNAKRHGDFVSFLGRSFVSGDNSNSNELLEKEPRTKQRLKDFWDWMLKNYKNTNPFIEFSFWINLEKDIFEPAWLAEHIKKTLEKTKGGLDWDYGLMKSIIQLAKDAPKDSLAIARLYLFEGGVRGGNIRIPFRVDGEWFEAMQALYDNQTTKKETVKLIDDLIREGGSIFWKLKEILNDG